MAAWLIAAVERVPPLARRVVVGAVALVGLATALTMLTLEGRPGGHARKPTMHTPSTRILSALAYERGEEFDPELALTPDLLEALSLIEQARPIVGDDGPYELARQRRRERREQAGIPDWFSAEDLIVAAWEATASRFF